MVHLFKSDVLWNTDLQSVRRQAAVKTKSKLVAGFEPAFPSIALTELSYSDFSEAGFEPATHSGDRFLENSLKPPNQVA